MKNDTETWKDIIGGDITPPRDIIVGKDTENFDIIYN
jgi:hypothetical protein